MQFVSVIWGMLALIGAFVAFFPCLGWLNWLNIPFALLGLVLSLIARDQEARSGRAPSNTAVILNGAAMAVGFARLAIGGGLF